MNLHRNSLISGLLLICIILIAYNPIPKANSLIGLYSDLGKNSLVNISENIKNLNKLTYL